jgi:hypothetical protein
MIYEFPASSAPIRQGDIFIDVPRVEFELSSDVSVLEEDHKVSSISWEELVREKKDVAAVLGITLVPAIVATQSCDAQRKEYVTLCEIVDLEEIGAFREHHKQSPKSRVKGLLNNERKIHSFFYLPPDDILGFELCKAVQFSHTMRIARNVLEIIKDNRKGRLNATAYEHFREKFSNYYRRYAFDEWYMLNKDELREYEHFSELTSDQLYPWHK